MDPTAVRFGGGTQGFPRFSQSVASAAYSLASLSVGTAKLFGFAMPGSRQRTRNRSPRLLYVAMLDLHARVRVVSGVGLISGPTSLRYQNATQLSSYSGRRDD